MTINIKTIASLATIAALLIAVFQLGISKSSGAETIRINIQNSLENAISSLPENKKSNAKQVINPVLELVAATDSNTSKQNVKIDNAAQNIVDALSNLTIVSYLADEPPFVPPKEKVQYVCEQSFTLAYTHKYDDTSKIVVKINGRSGNISPGDMKTYQQESTRLELTYLEYSKELSGPVLNYRCYEA